MNKSTKAAWELKNLESILFDELVQVHRKQLKCHAYVIAEVEALEHVHQIHVVVFVLYAESGDKRKNKFNNYLFLECLQNANLLLRLAMEAFFIAHNFQRHVLLRFVIESLDHLAEAAFAYGEEGKSPC